MGPIYHVYIASTFIMQNASENHELCTFQNKKYIHVCYYKHAFTIYIYIYMLLI